MARKKEELDAQNAQWKHGGRPGPRQGPRPGAPAHAAEADPVAPAIAKAADLADLPGVWLAARNYLAAHARLLESVLGNCTHIASLNRQTGETVLTIPNHFRGYANDKGRPRLEEALRAVTDVPVKLSVQFTDEPVAPPHDSGMGAMHLGVAQRIPPEIMEAVEKQPIIRELMKRLDATVTQVEILDETPE